VDSRLEWDRKSATLIETGELTGDRLEAVAAIWKRERRQLTARFGGTSMEPTIAAGSEVLLLCGVVPEPGGIAAFTVGGRLIVHRVLARSPDRTWLLTRGDAAAIPDPPITQTAVIGAVTLVQRGDRFTEPAAPPPSLRQRLLLGGCLLGMRASPAAGARVIDLLWFLRRWLVLAPRAVARRVGHVAARRQ
jgi:hypothetical protein